MGYPFYCGKTWPKRRVRSLVRMWADGYTLTDLQVIFAASTGYLHNVLYSHPVARALREKITKQRGNKVRVRGRKLYWTQERTDQLLLMMYRDGKTRTECELILGRRLNFAVLVHSKRGKRRMRELGLQLKLQPLKLAGKRFGKLKVIRKSPVRHRMCKASRSFVRWVCRCDCGRRTVVLGDSLVSKRTNTQTCGHVSHRMGKDSPSYKHGHYSKEWKYTHNSYISMVRRCEDPNNISYENYGGRGIRICERWRGPDGFESFVADIGRRPKGKSLDRIDPYKGYSPDNCRWATSKQQNNNKRMHYEPLKPDEVAALMAEMNARDAEVVF
jgi:hypothetical protein